MLAPSPRAELSLNGAVVYDIETTPSAFTMNVVNLADDLLDLTFEVSDFQDDRVQMLAWFKFWQEHQTIMIGFNSLGFDFPVLNHIWQRPGISVREIYEFAMRIIANEMGRFGAIVYQSERFAPQCDLFKLSHFDNRNKTISLKGLEVNMRSETVMEMPIPFGVPLTATQIKTILIPYNKHDVKETRKFARFSMDAITLRLDLLNSGDLTGDVLNFSDTKIGGKLMEQRLGRDTTHDENGNLKQTFRTSIPLGEIILPYVRFRRPEFQTVLDRIRATTLMADQIDIEADNATKIKTKGVFANLTATLPCGAPKNDPFGFDFGVGGIHGSVSDKRFDVRGTDWRLVDIDVTGLYPSIAIVNKFYPEHLGERFVQEYAKLPIERAQYKKGTAKNLAFKLAANGTYGNSNNQYSVFYDARFTMSITINGQLLLCMLAEWLMSVQSLSICQVNTDGTTYLVHKDYAEHAVIIRRIWERLTGLQLEEAEYGRMWIRNCNNYIAETLRTPDKKEKLKLKGDAYWYPEKFPDDISAAACWHKNFSAMVVPKAAVANMVHGMAVDKFIYDHKDPFDFMCRTKIDRSSKLYIGNVEQQRVTRYYIAVNGEPMTKISPPTGESGTYKRKNKLSDYEYQSILQTIEPGTWDSRIHTKNKSKYETRTVSIEAGQLVKECNVASRFDWEALDYSWYIRAAEKLIIPG